MNRHSYSHHVNEALRAAALSLTVGLDPVFDEDGEPLPLDSMTIDKLKHTLRAFDQIRRVWDFTVSDER